jgi:hypothetical protein
VILGKMSIEHKITSVAQIRESGNSNDMALNLNAALLNAGLQLKPPVAAGGRKAENVVALISYKDGCAATCLCI